MALDSTQNFLSTAGSQWRLSSSLIFLIRSKLFVEAPYLKYEGFDSPSCILVADYTNFGLVQLQIPRYPFSSYAFVV